MSDYMKEAERLMRQYTTAVLEQNYEAIALYHFTLLAHIQRGAVPEALDPEFLIGYLEEREDWRGREVLIERIRQVAAPDHFRGVTKMVTAQPRVETFDVDFLARLGAEVPAPAEVPMPEPVAYGFGNTAITGHTNRLMMVRLDVPLDDQYAGAFWLPLVLADEAHTYGVACRAAGEAAGYARGLEEGVARTGLTPAEHDVMAERQRQISAEGWTPEHDDEHDDGSLAAAAACYALGDQAGEIPAGWPQSWDESWWRPSAGERRNLVKAGALIIAEIERMDRASLRGEAK